MEAGTFSLSRTALHNGDVGVKDGVASTSCGGRSLLRHIFRSESSANGTRSGATNSTGNAGTEHAMSSLAHCQVFTPLEQRRMASLVAHHSSFFQFS